MGSNPTSTAMLHLLRLHYGKIVFIIYIAVLIYGYLTPKITLKRIYYTDTAAMLTSGVIINSGKKDLLYEPAEQFKAYGSLVQENVTSHPISLPFRNPPFVAYFFVILAPLGLLTAYKIFFVLNIILLHITVYLLSKNSHLSQNLKLTLFSSFLLPTTMYAILLGQLSIIILFLLTLAYITLINQKDFQSGIITSLLLIKPQYFIIWPFL